MSMRLWEKLTNVLVGGKLTLGKNASLVVTNSDNSQSTVDLLELAALDGIVAADLAKIDGITNGTAAAGKALVLGASLEIGTIGAITTDAPITYDHNTTITAFATGGQASATALTGEFNNVTTCATASDSVKLLAAVLGRKQTVKNSGAAALAVFPATGDAINALAANLSVDIPVNGQMTFRAIDATTYETEEMLVSQAPSTQKGSLVVKAADSAGNTVTTVTNASQAAARTYTIPDAGASASFVMTTGTATATTATTAELNYNDIATLGTLEASKAWTSDASLDTVMPTGGLLTVQSGGAITMATGSTLTASGAVVLGAGATLDLDSATQAATGNDTTQSATVTKMAGTVTTGALTTAANADTAVVLTLTGVAAGDLVFVTLAGGTNTTSVVVKSAIATSNTITVVLRNDVLVTTALNGTVAFHYLWCKA